MNASDAQPPESAPGLELGSRWLQLERFEQKVRIVDVDVQLAGFSVRDQASQLATGSAASLSGSPVQRAYFEVIERTSILEAIASGATQLEAIHSDGCACGDVPVARVFPVSEAGESFRYSLSNGVALGATAQQACEAARLELIERDRVLASWYGHGIPEPLAVDAGIPERWKAEFEFRLIRFPPWRESTTDEVVGLVAFPLDAANPLALGFGASTDLRRAVDHAARECIQVLGFLWGEPLPNEPPPVEASPDFHQATYLVRHHHDRIRAWLDGQHARAPTRLRHEPLRGERTYVNLTPAHLKGRVWVVKALPDGELPLVFGIGHPNLDRRTASQFYAHPIT